MLDSTGKVSFSDGASSLFGHWAFLLVPGCWPGDFLLKRGFLLLQPHVRSAFNGFQLFVFLRRISVEAVNGRKEKN